MYCGGMLKGVLMIAVGLAAFPGLFLAGMIFKMGLERSLELYGVPFTVIAGLGLLPVLLSIGFLFDRQEQRKKESETWREDRQ